MSGGNQFDWMSCLSIENEILMTVDMDDLVFEATMNAYVDPSLNGSTRFNSTRLDSVLFHSSCINSRWAFNCLNKRFVDQPTISVEKSIVIDHEKRTKQLQCFYFGKMCYIMLTHPPKFISCVIVLRKFWLPIQFYHVPFDQSKSVDL